MNDCKNIYNEIAIVRILTIVSLSTCSAIYVILMYYKSFLPVALDYSNCQIASWTEYILNL